MTIAIASTRGPKVEAVRAVISSIQPYLDPESKTVEYLTYEIDGGTVMPRSEEELLDGAEQRVNILTALLKKQSRTADFIIGMEGGFHTLRKNANEMVYLQSWAYVSDGTVGHWGSSGNILVPARIAREVMNRRRDLADVIDEVTKETDVRSRQGTWGILTRDLLTRRQSFEIALLAAFAPFYNPDLYR